MSPDDRALVTADLQRLPGLRDGWAAHGASLGVAVTSVGGVMLGLTVGSAYGALYGAAVSLAVCGPAALVGAWLGRRWRRGLLRDGGRVTVAGWLRRHARDGAVVGATSGATSALLLGVAQPGGVLQPVIICGLVGGLAGATLLAGLGLPISLRLARGKKPWGWLALAAASGPPVLGGAALALGAVLHWLF